MIVHHFTAKLKYVVLSGFEHNMDETRIDPGECNEDETIGFARWPWFDDCRCGRHPRERASPGP